MVWMGVKAHILPVTCWYWNWEWVGSFEKWSPMVSQSIIPLSVPPMAILGIVTLRISSHSMVLPKTQNSVSSLPYSSSFQTFVGELPWMPCLDKKIAYYVRDIASISELAFWCKPVVLLAVWGICWVFHIFIMLGTSLASYICASHRGSSILFHSYSFITKFSSLASHLWFPRYCLPLR